MFLRTRSAGQGVVLSVLVMVTPSLATAHGNATGIVKERMEMMKTMGKQMRTLGAMAKGKIAFDLPLVASHAQSMQQAAPEIAPLFPEGSLHKPTEALPRIWDEWQRFTDLADQLGAVSAELKSAAEQQDTAGVTLQFKRVGEVCQQCHDDYRVED